MVSAVLTRDASALTAFTNREVNVSESQYGGSFAFALAVLTNNVELIKHTAKSAVKMTQLPESYGVPPIWKKRLVLQCLFPQFLTLSDYIFTSRSNGG